MGTIRSRDLPPDLRLLVHKQHPTLVDAPGNRGLPFERRIKADFLVLELAGIARLRMLPVPTAPTGGMNRVLCGTADFDAFGWMMGPMDGGVFVGVELKSTNKKKRSLPIAEKSGLRIHQLDALAFLAKAGGIARLVWANGQEVGVLRNRGILAAHTVYHTGKRKSIPWSCFEAVQDVVIEGAAVLGWL